MSASKSPLHTSKRLTKYSHKELFYLDRESALVKGFLYSKQRQRQQGNSYWILSRKTKGQKLLSCLSV